jgi:cytochrome P450
MTTALSARAAPPLADGLPLIGSLLPIIQNADGFFKGQYMKHGSCYRVRVLGSEFVVMGGPDAVEALNKNAGEMDAWQTWENIIREFGGRHVITMLEGEKHLKYRKATRAGFSKSRVLEGIPSVIALTRDALNALEVGAPFQLLGFIQRLVADSVGTLTLGRKPGAHLADFMTWWHMQLAVNLIGSQPPSALRRQKYLNAKASIRAFAQEILDANDAPSSYITDLKGLMQDDPELMNSEELLFMTLMPYVAGLDTVVNTVALTLYELYRRPEWLERVQTESRAVLEAGFPPEAMRDLKSLHAAVLETMRYHTIANLPTRHAKTDFEFQGFQIKTGQKLMMHMNAASRDPKLFLEPDKYDPERFLAPRNEHKQPGAMNPYGAGAHTCLGAGMAEALMAVLIATITTGATLEVYPAGYQMKPFQSAQLLLDSRLRFVRAA